MKNIKTFCIIGDPIAHSLSPLIYNSAFKDLGLNYTYISIRVPKNELKEYTESLRSIDIAGFNVTIPHKVSIINYLNNLDALAKKANAVNTVKNENGLLKGFNTDVMGFLQPLKNRQVCLDGLRILVIGSGGAARAVISALSNYHSKIYLVNRTMETAKSLINVAKSFNMDSAIVPIEDIRTVSVKSDLIVNTTPLGMNGEKSIIDYNYIQENSIVYDIVYKPILTDLLANAKKAGAKIIYGYEMLLEQAFLSFEVLTGMPAPKDSMRKSLFGSFGEPFE